MPVVCVNRPNRTTPRRFSARDLERISRYVYEEGVPRETLLSSVAVGTDNVFLLCASAKAMKFIVDIEKYMVDSESLGVTLVSIEASIKVLERYGRRVPILGRYMGIVIEVLKLAQRIVSALLALQALLDEAKEIEHELKASCTLAEKRLKEILDAQVENIL